MIETAEYDGQEITVLDPEALPFDSFSFDFAPSGYDVAELPDHVTGQPQYTPIPVFPNYLIAPYYTALIVRPDNAACFAIYLGCLAEHGYLFGLVEPLSVFRLRGDQIKALHWAGLEIEGEPERRYLDALRCFEAYGLGNQILAFAVNQSWRPWHEQLQ